VGSTFLQKAIDAHPDIAGIDEIFVNIARKEGMRKSGFRPYKRTTYNGFSHPHHYIKQEIWGSYPPIMSVIFKLMYNQIDFHKGLYKFIVDNKLPIIHLMRRNLVKQVISGQNAATTKHDHIRITPDNLLLHVEKMDKLDDQWKNSFKGHEKLTLYYEDIIGVKTNAFTFVEKDVNIAICDFFGVKALPLFTNTKKKNKNNVWTYLKNRKEVERIFKGTKYQWMIEEE
jgi:hypothetical protein